jgi:hypothetical protein
MEPEPVQVVHHRQYVQWHVRSPIFERMYAFDPKEYRSFVQRMKYDCRKIIEQHHSFYPADFAFCPDHYYEWKFLQDILKKITPKSISHEELSEN